MKDELINIVNSIFSFINNKKEERLKADIENIIIFAVSKYFSPTVEYEDEADRMEDFLNYLTEKIVRIK